MVKIKLLKSERISISETPIMIVNNKDQRGYKTTHGFVPFGGIFVKYYNEFLFELSEIEKEMEKNHSTSYGADSAFFAFQSCKVQDIVDYIESGILTDTLQEELVSKSRTLPFQIGFYNGEPVLYCAGDESELMLYDILMVKENGIKIKFCKDCGNAFFPNTQGLYCSQCKGADVRSREKYRALKQDPVRLKYTRLQQRIQKREKAPTKYRLLFETLAPQNKNLEWLDRWAELDKEYQKLKRDSFEYELDMSETEWEKQMDFSQIKSIEDFEKWIKLRRANLPNASTY